MNRSDARRRLRQMGISLTDLSVTEAEKVLEWAAGLPKRSVDRFPRVCKPMCVTFTGDVEAPHGVNAFARGCDAAGSSPLPVDVVMSAGLLGA